MVEIAQLTALIISAKISPQRVGPKLNLFMGLYFNEGANYLIMTIIFNPVIS